MKNVWKKVSEQLPKQSCKVVIVNEYGSVITTGYSNRYKMFNAYDWFNSEDAERCSMPTIYWAYLEDILPEGFHV